MKPQTKVIDDNRVVMVKALKNNVKHAIIFRSLKLLHSDTTSNLTNSLRTNIKTEL